MLASARTKLTLSEFAQIMGIHPLHFAQIAFIPQGHQQQLCDAVYFKYPWQDADRVGRDDIARAIREAEDLIEGYLGYRLLPSWEVDEWKKNTGGWSGIARPSWGHFIAGGVQAKTLLSGAVDIDYSDVDGDGYSETATVIATVPSGTDASELALFYPGKSGDDLFEIRPLRSVVVAGTQATFVFSRHLCVLDEEEEAMFPEPIDGTDDDAFLENVDVYRRYHDPSQQVTMLWEPGGGCGCGSSGCSACSYTVQAGCLSLRTAPRSPMVSWNPSDWDPDTETFEGRGWALNGQPDLVRIWYYAGFQDKRLSQPRQELATEMKRAIAYLAAALLDRPPCSCGTAQWDFFRQDLALVAGSDEDGSQQAGTFRTTQEQLGNPFGTRRGQVEAWRRVREPGRALGYVALNL